MPQIYKSRVRVEVMQQEIIWAVLTLANKAREKTLDGSDHPVRLNAIRYDLI
jgi:hypothetical protein